jgi:putative membrane protein
MIYLLTLILTGCLLGTITGLTPGLHVNTVCLIGLSLYPSLGLSTTDFGVVMVSMAVSQTFMDFIPAIFIGVPEEETALSILPAHRMVMKGRSMEVVYLTAYGCLLGVVYSIILLIPVMQIVPLVYKTMKGTIIYVVIIAIIVLIIREKKRMFAMIAFLLSGYLGILSLNLKVLSPTEALFPLFSGLFGFSNIIVSLKDKAVSIPQKEDIKVDLDKNMIKSGLVGSLCGIIVGLLPAMSPSQVGIIAYDLLGGNLKNFLVSISAINTSDAIYSLVSLYTIDNPRSGVAAMLGQVMTLDINTLLLFVGVTAFTALIATIVYLNLGRMAMRFVMRINYTKLNLSILIFMMLLIYWITGWIGLLLSMLATAIGLIPILSGVSRTHLMGLLILPTIAYFIF